MLTLRAITRMTNDQLKRLGVLIGAIRKLKEEAKNNQLVTVNASLASLVNSTLSIASTSSFSPSPLTPPQKTLEKIKEAVGHLDTMVTDSKRKELIRIVCLELVGVSSMSKILLDLESLIAINTIRSGSWNTGKGSFISN